MKILHYNKVSIINISGVKGVSWCKRAQKWKVYLTRDGQRHYGGEHVDLMKAIEVRKELELVHWGEAISGKTEVIKKPLPKSFIKHYNLLKESSEKNNGFTTSEEKRLRESFRHFRKSHKRAKLTLEQMTMVEAIKGFVWYRRKDFTNNDYYDQCFELLRTYIKREGHGLVPVDTHLESGFHLGNWVNRMRVYYRQGKLPKEISAKLESYKEWIWEPNLHTEQLTFESHLKIFLDYVAKNGSLSTWDTSLKNSSDYMLRRNKKNTLSKEHLSVLESIPGWTWQRQKDQWYSKYSILNDNHKNILPQNTNYVFNGIKIGHWINQQRTFYKAGKLSLERARLLELIPNWVWKIRESNGLQWENWFNALAEYTSEAGTSRVSQKTMFKGFKIGQWCCAQRCKYKGHITTLTSEQVQKLESLKGWDWAPSRFNDYIQRLRKYALANKNTLVPKEYRTDDDNSPLGAWVSKQRSNFRYCKMSQEKIFQLQQIPYWVWERKSMDWDDMYFMLRAEAIQSDSFHITNKTVIDGHKIGLWVHRQRSSYNKGTLSLEKVGLLEQIKNWWWSKT